MKIASFFAGVGGIDLGFEQSGFEVVYANEIDKNPVETYQKNFKLKVDNRDIKEVKPEEVPSFDVLVGGFPCQAFSVAGKRQGFNDPRGTMFFQLLRFMEYHSPQVIFLENVKGLVKHDNGNTFKVIKEELEKLGYHLKYQVLNPYHYNMPVLRERIYIVGFKDKEKCEKFEFPKEEPLTKSFKEFLEPEVDQKYYYSEKLHKYYPILAQTITDPDKVYQWRYNYVRINKKNVIPTLVARNCDVRILDKKGIRRLTPRECFNFQGFPKEYDISNIADTHLYKQAGNSVCVVVIKKIADEIGKIFKKV